MLKVQFNGDVLGMHPDGPITREVVCTRISGRFRLSETCSKTAERQLVPGMPGVGRPFRSSDG